MEMNKSKRMPVTGWIAIVLVVISLGLMLLPWINITFKVAGIRYDLDDLIDLGCAADGMTREEFDSELSERIVDGLEELEDLEEIEQAGVELNLQPKRAARIVMNILDSKITIIEAADTVGYLGSLLRQIDKLFDQMPEELGEITFARDSIHKASSTMTVASVLIWVLLGLLAAGAIFAVISIICKGKSGPIVYGVLTMIPWIAGLIVVSKLNGSLIGSALEAADLDLADAFGDLLEMSSLGAFSMKFFHLSLWPVASCVIALAAMALAIVSSVSAGKQTHSAYDSGYGQIQQDNNLWDNNAGQLWNEGNVDHGGIGGGNLRDIQTPGGERVYYPSDPAGPGNTPNYGAASATVPLDYVGKPPVAPAASVEVAILGTEGVHAGKRFVLKEYLRVGRDPSANEVIFPMDAAGISARHCAFAIQGTTVWIKDLGSSYGTFVDGVRLTPQQPVVVQPGQKITLGSNRQSFTVALPGQGFAPQSTVRLQCTAGAMVGQSFALNGTLRIGRDPASNDVVLPPDTHGVSKIHCVVSPRDNEVWVQDLGSSYGTFVNGQRLTARQSVRVSRGEKILLGSDRQCFTVM